EATIMKAVVDAKMGDAAKDYTADHVAIAFAALTKDTKVAAPVVSLAPAAFADTATVVAGIRAARYA
ncbi:MAG: hypothetical protein B7Y38_11495, partial [Sphingomonadales bacterium 28-56-43]